MAATLTDPAAVPPLARVSSGVVTPHGPPATTRACGSPPLTECTDSGNVHGTLRPLGHWLTEPERNLHAGMAYGDELERELTRKMHEWREIRWWRELDDLSLHPDLRLDGVGWQIFYCAVSKGMESDDAARLAMDGNYRQRQRVRRDLWRRENLSLRRRLQELHPGSKAYDTNAPEQLDFWRTRLAAPSFVYFIQDGRDGPVKIGYSSDPERRLAQLQTGNPRALELRHVIPGDRVLESDFHRRFEPARIRNEWFGHEYLPVILAFAGGLADRAMHAYDGSGIPRISGANIRTEPEVARIRRDIEARWLRGFTGPEEIAKLLWLDEDEVAYHLVEMSKSTVWDIPAGVGRRLGGGRWYRVDAVAG